jgi:hypothetical protein
MRRLDEIWIEMLSEARQRAIAAGKADVVDYLDLRLRNDRLRTAAIEWLADVFIQVAAAAQVPVNIELEREEPHQFVHLGTTLTGLMLRAQLGVRLLTVEAGWPRMPGDGIVRGGALAAGRILHRGLPRLNVDLRLMIDGDHISWVAGANDGAMAEVDEEYLRCHLLALLDS